MTELKALEQQEKDGAEWWREYERHRGPEKGPCPGDVAAERTMGRQAKAIVLGRSAVRSDSAPASLYENPEERNPPADARGRLK